MKKALCYLVISYFFSMNLYAITLGVVPQQSPLKLMKVWAPIAQYLKKETGIDVTLKIESSITKFERVLYSGGYDIAYMNPYHYVVAHKKKGYLAKVKAHKNIVGILVTRKDSAIQTTQDCKNKIFLFPAPNAFAATLVTKYELLKFFNIELNEEKKFLYVNSHDSVYKGVARGIGDVGGGIERTFENLNDKVTKNSLNILYKTKGYPSHPFAFKPSLKEETIKKMSKAILNMPNGLLNKLSIKKMIKTDDSQYNIIRDIATKLKMDKN
ncbi:phosphate/phosphite/phosphonate ABC transporter substrate-binding protein [Candidatus Sulfurimonas baltica]|uniref:Phosphate/phosphite/phosphonate ABC transporter substrate-binding protein n=1 Tax=Candidatus Sulfurimonas baltica TaxID=2740404 RepID=A0A7S7LUH0_9BACT|nr:phosphate/phosphite/phosphonate ABC transporter substrate-binding protein [Candidatus Sulfurimonas baltica]QOY50929.1 phosphate/phosphite/phosphonate ABC transporter substrate-binding protein [Candidatus Sulfurimonas baltica]